MAEQTVTDLAAALILRASSGALTDAAAAAIAHELELGGLLVNAALEWGVRMSGDGDPAAFSEQGPALRFYSPRAGDQLLARTAAGGWQTVEVAHADEPVVDRACVEHERSR